MNPALKACLLGLLPVSELRGCIPLALYYRISPVYSFLMCVAANLAIIPIAFLFLDFVHHRLIGIGVYRRLFDHFVKRTRRKAEKAIERYSYLGLILFVGIPMPATGAYTGVLAAWLLGLDRRKASLMIALGVLLAAFIVTLVSLGGIGSLHFLLKQT